MADSFPILETDIDEIPLRFDWTAAVPKFDQGGELLFFLFPDPGTLQGSPRRFRLSVVKAFDLVLRQFQCLRVNWGLQDVIAAQMEILSAGGTPSLEHRAKAFYATTLLARGMEEFGLNLAFAVRHFTPGRNTVGIALSPLHRYGLWFCAEAVREHLLRVGQGRPEWMFEEPEIIERACETVLDELMGIEDRFGGAHAPAEHLMTLEQLQKIEEGSAVKNGA